MPFLVANLFPRLNYEFWLNSLVWQWIKLVLISFFSCLIVSYLGQFNSANRDLNLILVPEDTMLKYCSESRTVAAFLYHSNLSCWWQSRHMCLDRFTIMMPLTVYRSCQECVLFTVLLQPFYARCNYYFQVFILLCFVL